MDPTAPNNNQPNTAGATPPSPIQPGQFVVAGEDQPATAQTPIAPQAAAEQASVPTPAVSLAGERLESANSQVLPSSPSSGGSNQPDPTPFTSPIPGQQGAPVQEKTGGGSKKKGIIIAVAIVVLLAIIGAVVYIFVLPQLTGTASKTQTSDVVIEEPTPVPPNTGNGFGDIPESTTAAEQVPVATPDPAAALTTPTTTTSDPVSP